jgi:hypothetical protein
VHDEHDEYNDEAESPLDKDEGSTDAGEDESDSHYLKDSVVIPFTGHFFRRGNG